MSEQKHREAIDAVLTSLDEAAQALEGEIRSGSKLNADQIRRLRIARRRVIYVEEEATQAEAVRRAPVNLNGWPPGTTAEQADQIINRICGCKGENACDCVSVINKARGAAWMEHNKAAETEDQANNKMWM